MFTYHNLETAPEESKGMIKSAQEGFGMLPNLHAILAEAPSSYEAYSWLYNKFTQETTFTPLEQQVVMMASNFDNNCHYCVPAHTWIMKSAKMPEDIINSLREGKPLGDLKLEALRTFTVDMWKHRGHVGEDRLIKFFDTGYTKRHALEIMTGMACKLISNFTNGMTNTNVDEPFKEFSWIHPEKR